MPWPSTISLYHDQRNEYYGAYVSLLTYLFPHTEHFQVIPQVTPLTVIGSIGSTVSYMSHLLKNSTRVEADEQMRNMFHDLASISDFSRLERLYGVSALGTAFSVYQYTKSSRTLTPDMHTGLGDTVPAERWNYQLLEREGEAKFNSIINEVKTLASPI
ncbi:hypothetical protein BDQ17DRAFT_1343964 [Cyathus striatus]|nr:hypothetical protein BDQ17DRAFT_1343964 [Cyathus striatus]